MAKALVRHAVELLRNPDYRLGTTEWCPPGNYEVRSQDIIAALRTLGAADDDEAMALVNSALRKVGGGVILVKHEVGTPRRIVQTEHFCVPDVSLARDSGPHGGQFQS